MTHQLLTDATADQIPNPTTRTRLVAVAVVVLIFLTVVAAIAVRGTSNYRIAADQDLFHLPVVRQFAEQWPRPDLRNYASATAPGYHLLMAVVATYVSPDLSVLRTAGGVFGALFVGILAWATSVRSAWLALPAALSVYVLSSTVWLLPENAAWAFVTLAVLLALRTRGVTLYVGSALAFAALVFVRQTHVWAFGTLLAASYSLPNLPPKCQERGQAARLAVFTLLAIAPAVLILTWLVYLWHGLTPPAFQPNAAIDLPLATRTGGLAPGAPAMLLAVLGGFGVPLLAWLWPAGDRKKIVHLALLGAAIGLLLGVVPRSVYDVNNRSGLWNAVRLLPTVAGRSPLFVGLSMAGGVVATLAIAALNGRSRLVLAVALVGFAVVQMTNSSLWQRYYEPFVLLWLALAASEIRGPEKPWRWRAAGIAFLSVMQIVVVVYTLRGER